MTTTQTTYTFRATDMEEIEWAITEYATMIYDEDDTAEYDVIDAIMSRMEGTYRPTSLTLTDVERDALGRGLRAWHDNQLDDEHDGADHTVELELLDHLMTVIGFGG